MRGFVVSGCCQQYLIVDKAVAVVAVVVLASFISSMREIPSECSAADSLGPHPHDTWPPREKGVPLLVTHTSIISALNLSTCLPVCLSALWALVRVLFVLSDIYLFYVIVRKVECKPCLHLSLRDMGVINSASIVS